MRYKCWRANGREDRTDPEGPVHILCHDGAFESLPQKIRSLGPWAASRDGEVANLKPHYRMLLAEQGFVILKRRTSQLEIEAQR